MASSSADPLDFTGVPGQPIKSHPASRHPLGLPAGSVRSVLLLMVAGLIWILLILGVEKPIPLPLYLLYLLFLMIGSFFAAHGKNIAGGQLREASPWYLPRGTMRLLLLAGCIGSVAWHVWKHQAFPTIYLEDPLEQPYLPLWILGGFFAGMLLNKVVSIVLGQPSWYQDILAWVSLLALLGLVLEVVILVIINPSQGENAIHLPKWQTFLAAIISLYFGARS